jgi:hypothetical protein
MNGALRHDLPALAQVFDRFVRRRDPAAVPLLGRRFASILSARDQLAGDQFLESANEAEFAGALESFYEAVVPAPLHRGEILRRAGLVRFALNHLLHCPDSLPLRLDRILARNGAYHVAELGPAFWSAVCQAIDPARPGWLPLTLTGLRRFRMLDEFPVRPGLRYAWLTDAYALIRSHQPKWTGLDIDHFLACVAVMTGRDLEVASAELDEQQVASRIKVIVRAIRADVPLRRRLKEYGERLDRAKEQLETGLHDGHAGKVRAALAMIDPSPVPADSDDDLLVQVGRAWEADEPLELPAPIPALLHLRDPARFPLFNGEQRAGFAALDDSLAPVSLSQFCAAVQELRQRYQIHPYEVPAVLAALATSPGPQEVDDEFAGFCADSFRFLAELAANNNCGWMDGQRERYRFAVRRPMQELCAALAERYVRPVLEQTHGWRLETRAHVRRCLSSICKNNYGRSVPYETALWFAFYRPECGGKRDDVQLFCRLETNGLTFGLHLGRRAAAAGEQFRRHVATHAEALFTALRRSGALRECRFAHSLTDAPHAIESADDLRRWGAGKTLVIARTLSADSPLVRREELVGEVLLTFERLLAAYACAVADDPLPWLRSPEEPAAAFTDADFRGETYLGTEWLRKARTLLDLKRQLILQGVPGTGKTHVARSLARLLTGGRDDTLRLVQFHPGYSYEEFVEGIKAKAVEINGKHEVTYPVESGLLCSFAAEAAKRPAEPHVLVIDEINRGNLPRIFGELLYLLEYREQVVGLPYSRQGFQLPANLYFIGTMNAADRSALLLDQALRRRFSFLEMPPDPAILAAWLMDHPPKDGDEFAQIVVALFEGVNLRLRNDLGPQQQIGHSYFMVPNLDEDRLRTVWEHHVRPLLADYFSAQPARLEDYELDRLMRRRRREKAT